MENLIGFVSKSASHKLTIQLHISAIVGFEVTQLTH